MKFAVLAVYLVRVAFGYWLELLNRRHLREHGHEIPPEYESMIDAEVLRRTSDYNFEYSGFGMVTSAVRTALYLAFIFTGLIAVYEGWIGSITSSFVPAGVLYFLGLTTASTLAALPFGIYATFGIENRFGFNKMTKKLFAADAIKHFLVSAIFTGILAGGAFALIEASPGLWWLWVWAFVLAFQIGVMFIAPFLMGALFFKFEPLKVEGLEERIRSMMEKAGFRLKGVFQIDASRRTSHSNAFFMGLGRSKRIALFDTLLDQMTPEEILGVLGHEVGHWKKKHLLKSFVKTAALSLGGLFAAFHLLEWGGLPGLIGLDQATVFTQLVILGLIQNVVTYPLKPLFSHLSRRHERQADRFAAEITNDPEALASGMVKMTRDNLSNLHPHPLYAAFHYSHPPDVERVRTLRAMKPAQERPE
ncbi:MAG: M48 family metallopeptidase [Planctomycetota bacterium]|jgi:STE24 endopeptidase